jgi:hypothetical protein
MWRHVDAGQRLNRLNIVALRMEKIKGVEMYGPLVIAYITPHLHKENALTPH